MNKDQLYVERRPQGDYAIRRPNSQRASDVKSMQREAIERARELNPNGTYPSSQPGSHLTSIVEWDAAKLLNESPTQ